VTSFSAVIFGHALTPRRQHWARRDASPSRVLLFTVLFCYFWFTPSSEIQRNNFYQSDYIPQFNRLISILFDSLIRLRGGQYCDECVCFFVCPLAYLKNHTAKLCQMFVHVGHCSVCLWQRCNTLTVCTSGLWMTSSSCFLVMRHM